MVFFITVLRALAACLITNAHYTGIYPTDLIANGGLIGDIIFFAVSGWCLYRVRGSFLPWYGKRLLRVYPPVLIATVVYLLLGGYSLAYRGWFGYLVYPTEYHFVASILILYIPYFIVMKVDALRRNIPRVMAAVALIYVVIYCFFYDFTTYHIDNVREPMIRFLFGESMLLGAWFRQNDEKFRDAFNWKIIPILGGCFIAYFGSKLFFARAESWAWLQIVNQVLIFALLYCIFRLFAGLDGKLSKLPSPVKKVIDFVAKLTLEIYVVQNVLIIVLRPVFGFPINWLVITASILAAAFVLHVVSGWAIKGVETLCVRGKACQEK